MQTARALVPSGSVSVNPKPFRFRSREIILDAEWTVSVFPSELTKGLWFLEIQRQREGWEEPVTFKLWTYDKKRDRWKFERRMCVDLPLPTHIVPKWEMVLEAHGFRHD